MATLSRLAMLFGACALLGAWLTAIVHESIGPLFNGSLDPPMAAFNFVRSLNGTLFSAAFCAWLLGLLMLGAPAWWLLHQSDRRDRQHFAAAGAALTATAYITLFGSSLPVRVLPYVADMVIVGAIVGALFWQMAYRPRSFRR